MANRRRRGRNEPLPRARTARKHRTALGLGLGVLVACAASCHDGIDTSRVALPKGTLGDDLYGVLCDRVSASVLTEDVSGASYNGVCHYDAAGAYADSVNTSVLPPVSGDKQVQARSLALAKINAMVKRRSDLIRAFNAAFPDIEIDNAATPEEGDKVRLHNALLSFSQSLAPLYESNPFNAAAQPVVPESTRAIGRLMTALIESQEAREAFSKIQGRKGYRPSALGLGAIRAALAYPQLRQVAQTALNVVGPNGPAAPALEQLFRVLKQDLKTVKPDTSALPNLVIDAAKAEPNRPRTALEFAQALMMKEDPAFAADPNAAPVYLAKRDRRGFVMPLMQGANLQSPFVDQNADGYADTDAFGRFIDASGNLLNVDTPFAIPGVMGGPTDAFGRPATPLYQYIDVSRTAASSLLRNLKPLTDATQYDAMGGPNAWKKEHETLMYALAGAYTLYGDREEAQYDFENESIVPADQSCSNCLPYQRFRGEDSPIVDLIHAAGQIFADPDSDALLLGLMDLTQNHKDKVARLLGAALKIREITLAHDELALAGKEPLAELPYQTPVWDQVAAIMARILKEPGLVKNLVKGFGDNTMITPIGGAQHVGDTLSKFVSFKDQVTYNTNDLNGPPLNLNTNDASPPKTPVDRTQPIGGENRSALMRSFQIIHDANNDKACNKDGAKVRASILGLTVSWPLIGSYDECELFSFNNLGAFYIDALLDPNHPKRAELVIKDGVLDGIIAFLGVFADEDALFESSSGITGMTLHPTPAALNRLVFFGAKSDKWPNMPDMDLNNANQQTNDFVAALIEPVSPSICPLQPNGTRLCSDMNDLLRLRDKNTIFLWEHYGFYDYLRPLVTPFANVSCTPDVSSCDVADQRGEQMFIDLIEVLHQHWATPGHGPECNNSGDAASNPFYCSGAGIANYEPILSEAFITDIVPALVEFSKVATEVSAITVARGANAGQVWTGGEVLERLARILFDPDYAAQMGMVDRKGNAGAQWVDGTPQPQLTGYTLFADALHKIDLRFDQACDCSLKQGQAQIDCQANAATCPADAEMRKGQWKRARSQLVDQLLAVEGEGPSAKFKDPGMPVLLTTMLQLLREQLNANCPKRELPDNQACTWAKKTLGDKLQKTLSGPLFAALMDLQEALRADEPARREVEKLLSYLFTVDSPNDAFPGLLVSLGDLLQVLQADTELAPILNAIAGAAGASDDPEGAGVGTSSMGLLKAVTGDQYDKYHVMDYVLPAFVTPMDNGQGLAPIEIILDTISEVNRFDSASAEPLTADDYKATMDAVHGFVSSETRGLEQFYDIVKNRPRE